MGGSAVRTPAQNTQAYQPVYQKDGNYYKRDAPKQSDKGKAMGGPAQHGGNPMRATNNKGKASVPSYSQVGGRMQSMGKPRRPSQAMQLDLGKYQGNQASKATRQAQGPSFYGINRF
jgi:hypothetical protein